LSRRDHDAGRRLVLGVLGRAEPDRRQRPSFGSVGAPAHAGMPPSNRCTSGNKDAWLGTAFHPSDTSPLLCPGKVRLAMSVRFIAFHVPRSQRIAASHLGPRSCALFRYRPLIVGTAGADSAIAQQVVTPRPACSSAPWRSDLRTDPCHWSRLCQCDDALGYAA
jgi:hypothetical protein